MIVTVHLKPNAKERRVVETEKNIFAVSVTAPATEGKANAALLALLAGHFHVPKNRILLKRGEKSKTKVLEIL